MFQVTGLLDDGTRLGLDMWGGQQEARGHTSGAELYIGECVSDRDTVSSAYSYVRTAVHAPGNQPSPS
jgi:hypothetical protein